MNEGLTSADWKLFGELMIKANDEQIKVMAQNLDVQMKNRTLRYTYGHGPRQML